MKVYPKEFCDQLNKVSGPQLLLREERKKLQDLCPHVHLDGRTAFPPSTTFADCSLCGMSNHDL